MNYISNNQAYKHLTVSSETAGVLHNQLMSMAIRRFPKLSLSNYQKLLPALTYFVGEELKVLTRNHHRAIDVGQETSKIVEFVHLNYLNPHKSYAFVFNHFETTLSNTLQLDTSSLAMFEDYRKIVFEGGNRFTDNIAVFQANLKYNSIGSVDRELFTGLANTAQYSHMFWRSQGGDWGDKESFLVGDCLGFLGGWGASAIDEIWSNGGLSESNSGRRVSQGVWGATIGSLAGPLKPFVTNTAIIGTTVVRPVIS